MFFSKIYKLFFLTVSVERTQSTENLGWQPFPKNADKSPTIIPNDVSENNRSCGGGSTKLWPAVCPGKRRYAKMWLTRMPFVTPVCALGGK